MKKYIDKDKMFNLIAISYGLDTTRIIMDNILNGTWILMPYGDRTKLMGKIKHIATINVPYSEFIIKHRWKKKASRL